MMRKLLLIIWLMFTSLLFGQQQILFSFAETPQTLMFNPGAETNFKYHYGIPFFNNFGFEAGSTSFNLQDLFQDNNVPFSTKLERVVASSDERDFFNVNVRNDVLFGGFRLDNRNYLSFGFYQELDFIFFMPQDLLELGLFGNGSYINRPYSFSHLNFRGTINGVLHAGISRKVNEKLNIGARLKVYSASANVESLYNSGSFTTRETAAGDLEQTVNNANITARSSGLFNAQDQFVQNPRDLFTNTLMGGNLGIGVDVGFTYHLSPQLEITGSILDFGFIRFTKEIRTFNSQGSYTFTGVDFQYDPDNTRDYWQEIEDAIDENIVTTDNQDPYTSWRPTRINAALRYSFGDRRPMECFSPTRKEYFTKAIGFQLHSIVRPVLPQTSFTSFFENSLSPNFHVKLTHTVNNFSSAIIGAGLAFRWRTFNFVGAVDNVLNARNLETANSLSLNLGINFVIQ